MQEKLTVNVGGRVFYVIPRELLCYFKGTVMAELFSGKFDRVLQRDNKGMMYLDLDAGGFEW